jgi:putative endonuclease
MRKSHNYYVYMTTNQAKTVIYTGVTSDLARRVSQHKFGEYDGFTKRYRVNQLVWYEHYPDIRAAIEREKQIKAGNCKRKMALIDAMNPTWKDLYLDFGR